MWILIAALCLAAPILISGEHCDLNRTDIVKNFTRPGPFLPEGDGKAVTVWSEVTNAFKKTFVVREAYDKESNRYFLEYYDGNVFQKLLYDRKNKLFYSYTDSMCSLLKGSQEISHFYRNTPLFESLELENVPENGFLGPASIFDEFSASEDETGRFQECTEFDRFIPCVQYRQCSTQERTLDFWYSTKDYEIFSQKESQPLRVKLPRGATVDILSVKVDATSQDLFIPTGLGCRNPNEAGLTVPFGTAPRSFVGEVVMTTDLSDKVYVSQLNAIIIPSPNAGAGDRNLTGIYSFSSTNFKITSGGMDLAPGNQHQIIYDIEHSVLYDRSTADDENEIAVQKVICKISRDNDYHPTLEVPGYGRPIGLRSTFLEAPSDASDVMVSHIGTNKIDSVATDVYEVTETGGGGEVSRLVTSHHFHATTRKIVAVEINGFGHKGTKIFTVTIYISKHHDTITQLNEKLRIDDCLDYIDHSESRWLQLGFEQGNVSDVAQIERSAFQIREEIIKKLHKDFGVEPMRLPQINVDFVDQQLYVSALLLERPFVDSAFQDWYDGKDFINPTKVLGVMTERACKITCLGMKENDCTAISYCGATCAISDENNPTAPQNVINSPKCFLAERGFDKDMNVSSSVLRDLKEAAEAKNLRLSFKINFENGTNKTVTLTADSFDDTKNFDNVFHFDKDKSAIIEIAFNVGKSKKKYKTDSAAHWLGSLEQEDCAKACENRADCESFSWCMNSRECMVSRDHDLHADQFQEDSECIVYQKKYVDRFEKYPGKTLLSGSGSVNIVTNVESCAQKCVQRGVECKSFEFCDTGGECALLEAHIADVKTVDKRTDELKCDHYSKKFLFDYAVVAGKQGEATVGGKTTQLQAFANITQATCAKLCSEWNDQVLPCLSFDFCAPSQDNTGVCTLRTVDGQGTPSESRTCNFFYLSIPPSKRRVAHSSALAIGLSFLMIVIGAVLAVGGLFLYGKYR